MSLCESPLPADCRKEIDAILQQFTSDELQVITLTYPAFHRGSFHRLEGVRLRLRDIVCAGPIIKDGLRKAMAHHSPCARVFYRLSPDIIKIISEPLASLRGQAAVLVALLVDSREEVRQIALERLGEKPEFMPVNKRFAREMVLCQLSDILDLTTSLQSETDTATALDDVSATTTDTATTVAPNDTKATDAASANEKTAPASFAAERGTDGDKQAALRTERMAERQDGDERLEDRLKKTQTQLQEQNREIRRLKNVEAKYQEYRQRANTLQGNLTAAQKKIEAGEKLLRRNEEELKTTQVELRAERHNRQQLLETELRQALARELHGWLGEAYAIEKAAQATLTAKAGGNILERAAAALRQQAATDRNYGNRRQLSEQLGQLRAKLVEVRDALDNAMQQQPELKAVARELEGEIVRIEALLKIDKIATLPEDNLRARINDSTTADLTRLHDLIEQMDGLRVFEPEAIERLRQSHRRQLDRLYTRKTPPPAPEHQPRTETVATKQLRTMLEGRTSGLLLVDGHNALGGREGDYHPELEHQDKRRQLVHDLVRLGANSSSLHIRLYFDGPDARREPASDNVQVIYSGGEGNHRADRLIIEHIDFLRIQDAGNLIILVSNDNELRQAAAAPGREARLMWINELLSLFPQ